MGGVIKNVLGDRQVPNNLKRNLNVEAEISKLLAVVDNLTTDAIPQTETNKFVSADEKKQYAASSQGIAAQGQATLSEGQATVTLTGIAASNLAFVQFFSINGGNITDTKQYTPICSTGSLVVTAIKVDGTTNTLDTSILNYFITTATSLP